MTTIHTFLAAAFSFVLDPLDAAVGPTLSIVTVAIVSSVAALIFVRVSSNPERLRHRRRRAEAELLVLRLYGHEPRTILAAGGRFVAHLGRYLGAYVAILTILIVPFGLLFANLEARYEHRALFAGEAAVVELVAPGTWTLETTGSAAVEAGPVRVRGRAEHAWRVRATGTSSGRLVFRGETGALEMELPASRSPRATAPLRRAAGLTSLVVAPAQPPIDPALGLESVRIRLPPLELPVGPWSSSWLVVFLAVSLAVGVALKRPLGIE